MKKIVFLLPFSLLASGCMATLTPSGDIYTHVWAPAPVVVVAQRPGPPPRVVPAPRPVVHHPRPVAHQPRPKPWGPVAFKRPSDSKGVYPPNRRH